MKKRILLIVTVYRVGERIYSAIPELSLLYDIDLLLINEMSKEMPWYGNIDPRKQFFDLYSECFGNIYDAGFDSSRQVPNKLLYDLNVSKYNLIIIDDDRDRYGLAVLYDKIKNKVPVIGCIHGAGIGYGSERFDKVHKKSWDYLFVFGDKDLRANNNHTDIFKIGIPSNDVLKLYERTYKNILVIINCLANRWSPVPVAVNREFICKSGITELQKHFNKNIVFKIKSRHVHQEHKKDIEYLHSILDTNMQYEIIMDCEDNNKLITDSFIVISGSSTLAFKSIQLGIPTVCIKGAGIDNGHFEDYKGLVKLDTQIIFDEIERQHYQNRDEGFIKDTIEGAINFSCTNLFLKNIEHIIK